MAKIPEVTKLGSAKLGKTEQKLSDKIVNFVDNIDGELVIADPEIAKAAIKSILLNEIGDYVKGAFTLTCDNINNMIERYNKELTEYAENRINISSQDLAEQLITRIIKDKMSKEFVDKLINELFELKNKIE